MDIVDATRSEQPRRPYLHYPNSRDRARQPGRVHPQPLITTIPALVNMGKQVIADSLDLFLDPFHWKTRLIGAPLMHPDESGHSQSELTHKVFGFGARPAPKDKLEAQPDLRHQAPQSIRALRTKGKYEKKAVHFAEPGHDKNPELYEAVLQADDKPRIIEVRYDSESNRWCVDSPATFPDREDPVTMLCSKSVLRAMTGDNTKRDPHLFRSTSMPRFQVNRLPDSGATKRLDGDPATVRASSHDLFHIANLEEFLLHTHEDFERVVAASSGPYMKHWLISLRQLVTMLSKPDVQQKCKAAFWQLFRRGFAEKISIQLWDADDPQPERTEHIEELEWTTWVTANKTTMPQALRQDLVRALGFFHMGAVSDSSRTAILHPSLSIMSHKGITSALDTKTTILEGMESFETEALSRPPHTEPIQLEEPGRADANRALALPEPFPTQEDEVAASPRVSSAKIPWSTHRSQHTVSAPGPRPYPRPLSPTLPDSVVDQFYATKSREAEHQPPPGPSRPSRPLLPSEPLAQEQHFQPAQRLQASDSTASLPPKSCRASSPTMGKFPSDADTSLDLVEASPPRKDSASVIDGPELENVYRGTVPGALFTPSGDTSSPSLAVREGKKRAATLIEQALRGPESESSTYERRRIELSDPELAKSYERATKMFEHFTDSWRTAASKESMTRNNAALPSLDVDATGIGQTEFSNQIDDVLYAKQQLSRSVNLTPKYLEGISEAWLREQERLYNERWMKREWKSQLAKEWAHLNRSDDGSEVRHSEETENTMHAAEKASQHSTSEKMPAQKKETATGKIEFSSDEGRNQPLDNTNQPNSPAEETCLSDDNQDHAVKAKIGTCVRQLQRADEAITHLRRMLDTAGERWEKANARGKQQDKALEKLKEELAQLRSSLRADAKEAQAPAEVFRTSDCPQALLEDRSQWSWDEALALRFESCTSAEGKDQSAPAAHAGKLLAPDDGKATRRLRASQQSDADTNNDPASVIEPIKGEMTKEEHVSETVSLNELDGTYEDDGRIVYSPTIEVSPVQVIKTFPPSVNSDEDIDHINSNADMESEKAAHGSSSGNDRDDSQANSHVSMDTAKFADSNDNPLADQAFPSGVIPTDDASSGIPVADLADVPDNDLANVIRQGPTSHSKKRAGKQKKTSPVRKNGKAK